MLYSLSSCLDINDDNAKLIATNPHHCGLIRARAHDFNLWPESQGQMRTNFLMFFVESPWHGQTTTERPLLQFLGGIQHFTFHELVLIRHPRYGPTTPVIIVEVILQQSDLNTGAPTLHGYSNPSSAHLHNYNDAHQLIIWHDISYRCDIPSDHYHYKLKFLGIFWCNWCNPITSNKYPIIYFVKFLGSEFGICNRNSD